MGIATTCLSDTDVYEEVQHVTYDYKTAISLTTAILQGLILMGGNITPPVSDCFPLEQ